ncbi:MAG TPA: type IV toxin-antitoxin system AbiEi family antitoxin domain-containing protein [Longimicrobiaceae bacterium]|nr:type IV toxin-antitoxin system AbiEi family antitoxin domain-containing protein [Longimicrobiaceae bacterium]
MTGAAQRALFDIAAEQHGYLTASQAQEAGVSRMALVMMARRGTVERVSHGVYRLVQFPISPLGQYMEASLWPGGGVKGVISHESALSIYEVSDVSPAKIHITVPRTFRTRRQPPMNLVLHHADLGEDEVDAVEGIPVTTVERALRDCSAMSFGAGLLRDAIADARRLGLLTRTAAQRLRIQLLTG